MIRSTFILKFPLLRLKTQTVLLYIFIWANIDCIVALGDTSITKVFILEFVYYFIFYVGFFFDCLYPFFQCIFLINGVTRCLLFSKFCRLHSIRRCTIIQFNNWMYLYFEKRVSNPFVINIVLMQYLRVPLHVFF